LQEDWTWIVDETETVNCRFMSFKGKYQRYDLVAIQTNHFDGKQLILDLYNKRFSLLNKESLAKDDDLEHDFNYSEVEAEELRDFLRGHLE
jgi:hypothetical protein